MNVEDSVPVGQDAEDVCGEFYVTAAAGEGKDLEAGAGWGFEVIGDDLGLPGQGDGFELRFPN